jgi:transketolase
VKIDERGSETAVGLNPKLYQTDVEQEAIRVGFGRGLVEAGRRDSRVVALCADLKESTKMDAFGKEFPDRFVEIGVAEQNLVTVAAGMAPQATGRRISVSRGKGRR